MTPEARFAFASLLTMAFPLLFTMSLWWLGRPHHAVLRALLAIAAGWTLSIVMTSEVYNPAGIAEARARGEHFPEIRYDNNTVAVQILSGWCQPAIALLVARLTALCRVEWGLWRARRRAARRQRLSAARNDLRRASPGTVPDTRPVRPPAASW